MDKHSLEYNISNAWDTAKNVAKEVTKKPIKKAFATLFALGFYDSQAQVTSPIDSISVHYGNAANTITKIARASLWESKNGVAYFKNTVDLGDLMFGEDLPLITPTKTGFGVNYTDSVKDTIVVKGKVIDKKTGNP